MLWIVPVSIAIVLFWVSASERGICGRKRKRSTDLEAALITPRWGVHMDINHGAGSLRRHCAFSYGLFTKLNNQNVWFHMLEPTLPTHCLSQSETFFHQADFIHHGSQQLSFTMRFDRRLIQFLQISSRIVVNENLMVLRKKVKSFEQFESSEDYNFVDQNESPIDRLSAQELCELITSLPAGYRLPQNLCEFYSCLSLSV